MTRENYNLDDVCQRMLDNADLSVVQHSPQSLTLTFQVVGQVDKRYWRVTFMLDDVSRFDTSISVDEMADDLLVVLQVNVSQPSDDKWHMHIVGHDDMFIECATLNWQLIALTEDEHLSVYRES